MHFERLLKTNRKTFFRYLKLSESDADAEILRQIEFSLDRIETMVTPRWTYRQFDIMIPDEKPSIQKTLAGPESDPSKAIPKFIQLEGTKVCFRGNHIHTHLSDCSACLLLAVTLGSQAEQIIRAEESRNMALAVMLDTAASVLADQYADQAEDFLRRKYGEEGLFLTKRFSPGYGDFPIEIQPDFLRLLFAEKTIGLTVSQTNILLPRKSITAVLGVADHPVTGKLAGGCALPERAEESCKNCKWDCGV